MNLESIRQTFRPLFGVERRETTSRFLYAILISALIVNSTIIILRLLDGATVSSSLTVRVMGVLIIVQLLLLFIVKKGHVTLAAVLLIGLSWIGTTYQIWNADGIRDVAVFIYFVLILVAALLTNWQFSMAVSAASIISIWIFAIREANGLQVTHVDAPLHIQGI